jgi:hypothetical protein
MARHYTTETVKTVVLPTPVRHHGLAPEDLAARARDDAGVVLVALVPGALSFESLTMTARVGSHGDIAALDTTVGAIFSIALGTLVGWSVFNTLSTRIPVRKA